MTATRKAKGGLSFHARMDALPDFAPPLLPRIATIVVVTFAAAIGAFHLFARFFA